MYNHIANEFNAASTTSAIRRHLARLLARWADYRARKAAEQMLNDLDQHLLNDIGQQHIATGPFSLAAQNPHVIALNLRLLRLP